MKYVVSEDICIILEQWGKDRGLIIPDINFFDQMRSQMKGCLEDIFGINKAEMVSAQELKSGIAKFAADTDLDLVALDHCYFRGKHHLEINRVVDSQLMDQGERERFGHLPINQQIDRLKETRVKQVALIDDVVFSGNGIKNIVKRLRSAGIDVLQIIAGIAVDDGIKEIGKLCISLNAVREFGLIIDEVCERDFYPGVPHSGRSVIGHDHNVGAPYIIPFGKPAEWASIPETRVADFSYFCLQQSLNLWEEISRLSGRHITCREIARLPIGIKPSERCFVECLKKTSVTGTV